MPDLEEIWNKLISMDNKLDGVIKTVGCVATRAETAHTRINGLRDSAEGNRTLSVKLFVASLSVIAVVAGLILAVR